MAEVAQTNSDLQQYCEYDTGQYAMGIKIKEEDTTYMFPCISADLLDFTSSYPIDNLQYNGDCNGMQTAQMSTHIQDQLDANRWAAPHYDMNVSETMQIYNGSGSGLGDSCDMQNNGQIGQYAIQQPATVLETVNTVPPDANFNLSYDTKPKEASRIRNKPFKCPSCGHESSSRCHLVIHMRTHTGEKPYVCKSCNYKSNHKSNLTRHLKTHANTKEAAGKDAAATTVPFRPVINSPPINHPPPPILNIPPPPPLTYHPLPMNQPPAMNQSPAMNTLVSSASARHSRETPVYSCTSCSFKCDVLHDLKEHVKTHEKPNPVNGVEGVRTGNDNGIARDNSWQGDERPYMLQAINVVLDLLT